MGSAQKHYHLKFYRAAWIANNGWRGRVNLRYAYTFYRAMHRAFRQEKVTD